MKYINLNQNKTITLLLLFVFSFFLFVSSISIVSAEEEKVETDAQFKKRIGNLSVQQQIIEINNRLASLRKQVEVKAEEPGDETETESQTEGLVETDAEFRKRIGNLSVQQQIVEINKRLGSLRKQVEVKPEDETETETESQTETSETDAQFRKRIGKLSVPQQIIEINNRLGSLRKQVEVKAPDPEDETETETEGPVETDAEFRKRIGKLSVQQQIIEINNRLGSLRKQVEVKAPEPEDETEIESQTEGPVETDAEFRKRIGKLSVQQQIIEINNRLGSLRKQVEVKAPEPEDETEIESQTEGPVETDAQFRKRIEKLSVPQQIVEINNRLGSLRKQVEVKPEGPEEEVPETENPIATSTPKVSLAVGPTSVVSNMKPGTIIASKKRGGKVKLEWIGENVDSCSYKGNRLAPSGSMTVSISKTTTYTISCTGPKGTVKSNSVKISFIKK